jgi:hypothetical protein
MPKNNNGDTSRRDFLLKSGGICSGALLGGFAAPFTAASRKSLGAETASTVTTRSDVGSLFPVIQSEVVQSDFPLSFLNSRFKNVKRWKKTARREALEEDSARKTARIASLRAAAFRSRA